MEPKTTTYTVPSGYTLSGAQGVKNYVGEDGDIVTSTIPATVVVDEGVTVGDVVHENVGAIVEGVNNYFNESTRKVEVAHYFFDELAQQWYEYIPGEGYVICESYEENYSMVLK